MNIWVIPKYSVSNRVKGGMFNYWWLRSSTHNFVGTIVYEDDWQVAVSVKDGKMV